MTDKQKHQQEEYTFGWEEVAQIYEAFLAGCANSEKINSKHGLTNALELVDLTPWKDEYVSQFYSNLKIQTNASILFQEYVCKSF
jgi:hypothetical protein